MQDIPNKLLLGAHMSIEGGIDQALYRGNSIGCTTIQLFTSNNRQWRSKDLSPESIEKYKKAEQITGIYPVISHASYLINLASTCSNTLLMSKQALHAELKRCSQLTIPYLVLHPGSGKISEKTSLDQIIQNLNDITEQDESQVTILLENTAGQGTTVGYSLEHLAYINNALALKNRIGICFDTCHAFAAGYNFATQEAYKQFWDTFDKLLGIEKLKVIHLNDSKKEQGSRKDRHESIGKGKMGLEPFRLLINDTNLSAIPKILETPKESLEDDEKNLSVIKGLLDK
jgi:deoxyribonuclease IV